MVAERIPVESVEDVTPPEVVDTIVEDAEE